MVEVIRRLPRADSARSISSAAVVRVIVQTQCGDEPIDHGVKIKLALALFQPGDTD